MIGLYIDKLYIGQIDVEQAIHQLLIVPLRKIAEKWPARQIVIIVDGLDEAEKFSNPNYNIVTLLPNGSLPPNIRFLLSSRLGQHLSEDLLSRAEIFWLSEDEKGNKNPQILMDAELYMEKLAQEKQVSQLLIRQNINPEQLRQQVARASQGNFLYLYHYAQGLRRNDESLLNLAMLPNGLYGIYKDFLSKVRVGQTTEFWDRAFKPALGVLAVAREPLTRKQISDYTKVNQGTVGTVLTHIQQFLISTSPGRDRRYAIYHSSFGEYLVSEENEDYIGQEPQHRIIEYYLNKPQRWGQDQGYASRHLTTHLRTVGEYQTLFDLAEDLAWYEAQIAHAPSGVLYRNDLMQVWEVAEALDTEEIKQGRLPPYLRNEIRSILAITSVHGLSGRTPPALLVALFVVGEWELPDVLTVARQHPEPDKRAKAINALLPHLPPDIRQGLLQEALAATDRIGWVWTQAEMRLRLSQHLPINEREGAERQILADILNHEQEWMRTDTLTGVMSILPEYLLAEVVEAIWKLKSEYEKDRVLAYLVPRLPENLLLQILDHPEVKDRDAWPVILAAQSVHLSEEGQLSVLRQAFAQAITIEDDVIREMVLAGLMTYLPESFLRHTKNPETDLTMLLSTPIPLYRELREILIPRLVEAGNIKASLDLTQSTWPEWQQTRLLTMLAPRLSQSQLSEALAITREMEHPYWRTEGLGILIPYLLPETERFSIYREALALRAIGDTDRQVWTLAVLACYLSEPWQREAIDAMQHIKDEFWQADGLAKLAPSLADSLTDKVFDYALYMRSEKYEVRVYKALASKLSKQQLRLVLIKIHHFSYENQIGVIKAIVPYLPESLLSEAFRASENKVEALITLIPSLPDPLLLEVLEVATTLEDPAHQVRLLAMVAPHLPDALQESVVDPIIKALKNVRFPDDEMYAALALLMIKAENFEKAIEWTQKIEAYSSEKVRLLVMLAPLLPEPLLPKALKIAQSIGDTDQKIHALAALTPRLLEDPLEEIRGLAQKVIGVPKEYQSLLRQFVRQVLLPLYLYLPEAERLAFMYNILNIISFIPNANDRVQTLALVGPYLLKLIDGSLRQTLYDLWRNTLHLILTTSYDRESLLGDIGYLAPVIVALGGTSAVEETFRAVQTISKRWP